MGRRKRIYGKRRKKSAFKKDNEPDWNKLGIHANMTREEREKAGIVDFKPTKDERTLEQIEADKKRAYEYNKIHGAPGSIKRKWKDIKKAAGPAWEEFKEKQRAHTLSDRVGAAADGVQIGLSGAGLIFPQADALNAVISSTRAGYAKSIGDDEGAKKHGLAAAVNTAAILPGAKELYKGTRAGNIMVQSATKQADDLYKVAKNIKNAKLLDVVGAGTNLEYWRGTAKSIKDIASK
tara:strand:+ start:2108 stop:2815 length:708 start_codon:yes stop_codon:yes gene_type:complete